MQSEKSKARFPVFRDRFRELQGERSDTEFAKILGITRQSVGFYKNGDRVPDALMLLNIAKKMHVSVDWLLDSSIKAQNPDTTVQAICAYTGLTEDALDKIVSMRNSRKEWTYIKDNCVLADIEDSCTALNLVLCSSGFGEMIHIFGRYLCNSNNDSELISRLFDYAQSHPSFLPDKELRQAILEGLTDRLQENTDQKIRFTVQSAATKMVDEIISYVQRIDEGKKAEETDILHQKVGNDNG